MQDDAHSVGATPPPPPEPASSKPKRAKPRRPLPTGRVTFTKQIRCLLSYGLESRQGTIPVRMEAVAAAVGMNPSTVSLCNPFFVDIGFLAKTGRGLFMPSSDVLSMVDAHQWNAETAPERLAPILRVSWAAKALESRLRLGSIGLEDGIQILAETVGAGPEYKSELGTIIEFLCISGVTLSDGHQLSWVPVSGSAPEPIKPPESDRIEDRITVNSPPDNDLQAGVPVHPTGAGGISFTVSIQVDTAEISGWSPERITAFFGGLAQVLAAQRRGDSSDR